MQKTYIHTYFLVSGLGFGQFSKELLRILCGANMKPVNSQSQQLERDAIQGVKNGFLELLRSVSAKTDIDAGLRARLVSLESGLQDGLGVEPTDLCLIGHILGMRIRCSMRPQFCSAITARPEPHDVTIFEDGIYGPQSRPLGLRVVYRAAFDPTAKRILQYEYLFPDSSGTRLLAGDDEIEQEHGPDFFQQPGLEDCSSSVLPSPPIVPPPAPEAPCAGRETWCVVAFSAIYGIYMHTSMPLHTYMQTCIHAYVHTGSKHLSCKGKRPQSSLPSGNF